MDIETANGSLDIWTIRSPGSSGAYISYPYLTWQTYDNPGTDPASNPIPGLTQIEPVDLAFKATGSGTSLFRPGAGSGTVTDVLVNSGYNGGTSDLLDQDFSYHQMKAVYQLIPSSTSPISMNTGSFYIRYDPARLTFVSASKGTFFPEENGTLFFETTTRDVTGSEGQPLKQMIFDTGLLSDHPNTALQNNTEPILNLEFTIQKSGLSEVTVDSAKISAFSEDFTGDLSIRYATEADTAKVEFWPGDVNRDGFVDFVDLTGFAASYFASADDPAYRIKYDFGSPSVFNYYHLPISDGDISFRDLIVFATGYSLSLDRRNATQLSGSQTSGSQTSGSQLSGAQTSGSQLPGSQLAGTAGQGVYPGDATPSSTQPNPYSESGTGHHHPTAASTSGATTGATAGATTANTAGTTNAGAATNENTATVNLGWTTPEQLEPSVYRFGLMAEGDVQNIRAAQIVLRHDPGMEILGVTLSEQPSPGDETKFSMFRTRENAADSSAWHGVRSEIDIASISKQPLLEENGTLMTFDVRFDADAEPTSTRIEMDHVTMVNAYGGLLQTSWDESVPPTPEIPASFLLHQNYPNPFNPVTVIAYDLPIQAAVTLEVYSITGQRIAVINRGTQTAGTHFIELDASRWASGAYIYRLRAGDFAQTRKMMLLK